jgi:hypothetical protein
VIALLLLAITANIFTPNSSQFAAHDALVQTASAAHSLSNMNMHTALHLMQPWN